MGKTDEGIPSVSSDTTNHLQKRFNGKIGRRLTILVIFCILISILAVAFIAIGRSRTLAENLLLSRCTSTTNILKRQLGDTVDPTSDYTKLLDFMKEDTGCELTIFSNDIRVSTTVMKDGKRAVGTPLDSTIADIVLKQQQAYSGTADILGTPHICSYVPIIQNGKAIGLIFAGISQKEVNSVIYIVMNYVVVASFLILAVSCILVYLFTEFSVTRPLSKLTKLAKEIENGNLGIKSGKIHKTDIHSSDEIGLLANTFEFTFQRLSDYIKEISAYLGKLADKDLRVKTTLDYVGDFTDIRSSLDNISNSLNYTMVEIHSASRDVSGGSGLVSNAAQVLSSGAAQQASAIEQLSCSVEDISAHVSQNAISTQDARDKAITIEQFIQNTTEQMRQMVSAMEQISTTSKEISGIDKTIEDIAFQTNILALNASVEAGRAGEAGKAFAAVAQEVRNLASKCSEASITTDTLIEHALKAIQEGTDIVNSTMQSTIHAADSIDEVVDLVTKVSAATAEQASSISQFSSAIKEISTIVQTNSETAAESASASEELSAKADTLKKMVDSFTLRS